MEVNVYSSLISLFNVTAKAFLCLKNYKFSLLIRRSCTSVRARNSEEWCHRGRNHHQVLGDCCKPVSWWKLLCQQYLRKTLQTNIDRRIPLACSLYSVLLLCCFPLFCFPINANSNRRKAPQTINCEQNKNNIDNWMPKQWAHLHYTHSPATWHSDMHFYDSSNCKRFSIGDFPQMSQQSESWWWINPTNSAMICVSKNQ